MLVVTQISLYIHRTLNHYWGSARIYSWLPGGQIWIEYNVQTQQFGPFKSADGQIALTVDNMPQDELISMSVWAGIWVVTPASKQY